VGYFLEPKKPPRFSGIAKPGGGVTGSCAGGRGVGGVCGEAVAMVKGYPATLMVHKITSTARSPQLTVNQEERLAIRSRLESRLGSIQMPAAR